MYNDIVLVFDESGSMDAMGDEPVQTINSFLRSQQVLPNADRATFSLWKFNNETTLVFDNVPLNQVRSFTENDYHPCGMTALHDAVCKAIDRKLSHENNRDVILIILTDGSENSSQLYSRSDMVNRIRKVKREYGWTVLFMGCVDNTAMTGNAYGATMTQVFAPTPEGMKQASIDTEALVSKLRSSMGSLNLS